MARLSGPSKGCRTCRKRHVKCDERQPSCIRCERGGFPCEGYGRDLKFVSGNSRAKERSMKQEVLRAKLIESENIQVVAEEIFVLPPELSHAAFKTDIQISFTLTSLFSRDPQAIAWLGWNYNTSSHNINSLALKALSNIYYGRKHHQKSFENDGLAYYLQTLRGLSEKIESHSNGISLDILIAGMTASIYEMIASPTHSGIMHHSGGVGKLIELRGPERHCSLFELDILCTMRTSICLKAVLDRKRCFLEKEEWITVPWSLHPEQKTMSRWIEDVLCYVPGLLEDYDTLSEFEISDEIYQLRLGKLRTGIEHQLRVLSEWRFRSEGTHSGSRYEQVPHLPHSPFSTILHYQNLEVANAFMLYNTLYIILSRLKLRLPDPDQHNNRKALTETHFDPQLDLSQVTLHEAAIEICRSVEYYLTPPNENSWAFFAVFPLNVAKSELCCGSIEQEWLKAVMVDLATKSVFPFSMGLWLDGVL